MSKLFQLWLIFLKIGVMAFGGGYAALPLIQQFIVEDNGWLTMLEMTDVVSISQMTPGPIAINSATFVGTKVAGVPGAIVATLANVTPQFFIMLFLAQFVFSGKKITVVERMLKGLRPGVIGMICVAALTMFLSSIWPSGQFSIVAMVAFIIGGFLKLYKKLDLMILIPIGAVIGIVGNLIL